MGRKTDAYVDTSALIAFADRSDTYHTLFKRLFSNPPRLVTTTLVVAEGHGWFLKRYDRTRALQFIALVEALSPMAVVSVGQEEQAGGIRMLRKFSDQDLTMTDAVGLHVMTASRIHTCWSTDRHLGLGGASLVTERNT
jgi:predicted nucleic acid-binding protein